MNCDFSPIGFLLLLLVIQSRLLSTLVVAVFFLRLSSVVVVVISLIINRIRKYQTNDDNVKKLRSGTGRGVLDRLLLLLSRMRWSITCRYGTRWAKSEVCERPCVIIRQYDIKLLLLMNRIAGVASCYRFYRPIKTTEDIIPIGSSPLETNEWLLDAAHSWVERHFIPK